MTRCLFVPSLVAGNFQSVCRRSGPIGLLVLGAAFATCCKERAPDGTGVASKGHALEVVAVPQPNGCLPPPAAPKAPTMAIPKGGKLEIAAYGYDVTDSSGVYWDQRFPSPCLDDNPSRKGLPNAAWQGSYWLDGDYLCLQLAGLYSQYEPAHELRIGYTVKLSDGVTFEDGSTQRDIVLHEFMGKPDKGDIRKCVLLRWGG